MCYFCFSANPFGFSQEHLGLKPFPFGKSQKDLADKIKEVNKEEKVMKNESMEIQPMETDFKNMPPDRQLTNNIIFVKTRDQTKRSVNKITK